MSLRGEVTVEVTPLELSEDGEELILETHPSELVHDSWFGGPQPGTSTPTGAPGGAAAASAADLDQLLGISTPRPTAAANVANGVNGVHGNAAPASRAGLADGEHRLFLTLERIARGQEPAQVLALLMSLLVRKGLVSEAELLDQLRHK
jgi:hypothetical protein